MGRAYLSSGGYYKNKRAPASAPCSPVVNKTTLPTKKKTNETNKKVSGVKIGYARGRFFLVQVPSGFVQLSSPEERKFHLAHLKTLYNLFCKEEFCANTHQSVSIKWIALIKTALICAFSLLWFSSWSSISSIYFIGKAFYLSQFQMTIQVNLKSVYKTTITLSSSVVCLQSKAKIKSAKFLTKRWPIFTTCSTRVLYLQSLKIDSLECANQFQPQSIV